MATDVREGLQAAGCSGGRVFGYSQQLQDVFKGVSRLEMRLCMLLFVSSGPAVEGEAASKGRGSEELAGSMPMACR